MVFGEKLDTFDESRKDLLEFQTTAIEFISSIMSSPPVYKYYPTKEYRKFVNLCNRLFEQGKCLHSCLIALYIELPLQVHIF